MTRGDCHWPTSTGKADSFAAWLIGIVQAAQLLFECGVTTLTLNQVAIARLGAMPQTIEVEKVENIGDDPTTPTPQFVPRVMQVMELAKAARTETNAHYIGTEHLLLGILREGSGMAVTLLQDLGVDLVELERQLLEN